MRKSDPGFTLIELLLYITILGTLLTSVVMFFNLTNEARIKGMVVNEVNEQGAYVMDYITQTVRNATSISSPAAAASGASLTLVVPTAANSPTIFALSSSDITVKEGTAAAVALDSAKITVSNLTITNATRSGTNGIVRVSFTLTYLNATGRNEYDYSKTFTSAAEVSW